MSNARENNAETVYEIKVKAILDERWSDWFSGLAILVETKNDGSTVTTLKGVVDQAALHGILARIRDLNLKLISVIPGEPFDNG